MLSQAVVLENTIEKGVQASEVAGRYCNPCPDNKNTEPRFSFSLSPSAPLTYRRLFSPLPARAHDFQSEGDEVSAE